MKISQIAAHSPTTLTEPKILSTATSLTIITDQQQQLLKSPSSAEAKSIHTHVDAGADDTRKDNDDHDDDDCNDDNSKFGTHVNTPEKPTTICSNSSEQILSQHNVLAVAADNTVDDDCNDVVVRAQQSSATQHHGENSTKLQQNRHGADYSQHLEENIGGGDGMKKVVETTIQENTISGVGIVDGGGNGCGDINSISNTTAGGTKNFSLDIDFTGDVTNRYAIF